MCTHGPSTAFALPDRLTAKSDPELIADDEAHLAAVGQALEESLADLTELVSRPPAAGPAARGRRPSTGTRRCTG